MAGSSVRVVGYDLARALAVFGMVIVNFKIVMGADSGPGWLAWLVGLLEGRAAATFVVLAGVGISLLSRQARESRDAEVLVRDRNALLRRAAFLFAVGLAYTPIWPADILHFYGVYIAVAAFLLAVSTRRLLTGAAGLVALFMVLLATFDYEAGWNFDTLSYQGFWTPAGMLRHLFFNGFHPVIPWLSFVLVGMALGRLDLSERGLRTRVLRWSIAAAVAAEVASVILIRIVNAAELPVAETGDLVAVFGAGPMPPTPLYMLAGAATAVAVITACVGVGLSHRESFWIRPLVATGQLALTLYVAHVVLGMGMLEAVGVLESQSLGFAVSAALVFCLAGIAFATAWRRRFRRGPLAWAMRAITDPR